MHTLGRHLIAELYGCDPAALDDLDGVRGALEQACHDIGATALQVVAHRFAPQGVTATVVIAESHLAIHTWPEHGYAAVDFFTCGDLDPRPGLPALHRALAARAQRVEEIARGIDAHVQAGAAVLPRDVRRMASLSELQPLPGPAGPGRDADPEG